jgi:DinB family protein
MSTATSDRSTKKPALNTRILNEGYGPGAWHGADLKAAIAGVTPEVAFWRPGPGRHNIAEIALHHAFYVHSVRGRLSAAAIKPFVREGEDWFALDDNKAMPWKKIVETVDAEQRDLATLVADIAVSAVKSKLPEDERFDLILGITCHAVYHAGQIQLIKVLQASA